MSQHKDVEVLGIEMEASMNADAKLTIEYQTPEQVRASAAQLVGMTFRDVLDLGIYPDGVVRQYNSRRYKGGMGNLLEERFFGYRANSDRDPDFAEAGVELKATCVDRLKSGKLSAGERLVLTMIAYDEPVVDDLYESHLWHKCQRILLVWYLRDRSKDPYDQVILYTLLFTPPEEDLRIIEDDYRVIMDYVRDGRADKLSESLTTYLGACTKGATRAKSMRDQPIYAPGRTARARAFSLKRSYMDYVLHHYAMGAPEAESVVKDPRELQRQTLTEFVTTSINRHVGKTDRELCEMLGMEYTGNKAQWTSIAYRLLGIRGDRAAEFEKAGIRVRTLRPEANGKRLVESSPILNIDFIELAAETDWEESELRELLSDMRYLLVVFQKDLSGDAILRGCKLWSMSEETLDGPVQECWQRTVNILRQGVVLTKKVNRAGKVTYSNNFPSISDNLVAHVRPRAQRAAYRFDGVEIGNVERDAEQLPDGRWMTRQAFWLNSNYMLEQITDMLDS